MNPDKKVPSLKPATSKESQQTLQDPSLTNPLRNRTNNDDGELISARIPTDANIGRSNTIGENIAAAIATPIAASKYELKPSIKRTASSELLRIEGLSSYMGACAAYKRGLEEGWENERLLKMVEEWQRMDNSVGKPGERG